MFGRLLSKLFPPEKTPAISLEELDIADIAPNKEALIKITSYLRSAELSGHYCEFGVYQGKTFAMAMQALGTFFPTMKFYAYDSFEGLPTLTKKDAFNNFTSSFTKGMFSSSESSFTDYLQSKQLSLDSVVITKGWFKDTLKKKRSIPEVAVAWVDCDLYSSTVDVLSHLTPHLQEGSIIVFDDWYAYRNTSKQGQQLACKEWLTKNKKVRLNPYFSYGWHGAVFTVELR